MSTGSGSSFPSPKSTVLGYSLLYAVQIAKPLEEILLFVTVVYINKVDLTQCSHLSIYSDETLLIVSQVFNAAARVTMQHSV